MSYSIKEVFRKIENVPENIKATVVFGVASFSISGLKYIMTPILTRLLTTSEYGTVGIYNSWLSIVQVIMSLTLMYPGILNVGLYEHKDNRWKYLSSMEGIITVVSLCTILFYVFAHRLINDIIGIPSSLVILMLITCLFQPASNLWTAKQRYEYKYKITFIVTVGTALLAQICSIVYVIIKKDTGANLAEARLWSAGLVNILCAVVIYVYILAKGKKFYDSPLWKETLILAIPLIPHYLSHVLLNGTDKIMIGKMIGADKAGIYNLAAVLSSIGILFWRALLTTFSPFVNTKIGERKFDEIRRAIKPLWIFTGGLCIVGALLSPEIIAVFGSKEYLEGIYVVPPVVAGVFTYTMYDAFAAVSFFHKKSVNIMIASVTAAMSNIVMNYFGIQVFGFIAAGYTTLISHLILILMHYINIRKIEKERIYDGKLSIISLLVVTIACSACNLLYGGPSFIRYILALVVAVYLFAKRRMLYTALANMKI